jgi:hypothetical protein
MSQVDYHTERIPLENVVNRTTKDDHIIIVRGPVAYKIFIKTVFPKETHYEKTSESIYEEFISAYCITEVIQSQRLKIGDSLWVWEKPAYSFEDVKRYHEEGFSSSPVIRKREPEFPFEGDSVIMFASQCLEKSSEQYPYVYNSRAIEGPGAKEKIVSLLKSIKKSSKKWWKFWK